MEFFFMASQSLRNEKHEVWNDKIDEQNLSLNGRGSKESQESKKGMKITTIMKWVMFIPLHWVLTMGLWLAYFVAVSMKIILKDDVAELGKKGQLIDVKAGYLRNFLLPMGMAQIVTPELLK